MTEITSDRPWEQLTDIIDTQDTLALEAFLDENSAADVALAADRLDIEHQRTMLTMLRPEYAARFLEEVSQTQAADFLEQLSPEQAAAIVDEIPSDHQADLLAEMGDETAEPILRRMAPEEAQDARKLLSYPYDTAGGLMITEYLAYRQTQTIGDVLADMHDSGDKYVDLDVQYMYVTDTAGVLTGVIRMRDLIFSRRDTALSAIMIDTPLHVQIDTPLTELEQFFDQHRLYGVPVVDHQSRLVGVVQQAAVEEASTRRSDRQFLGFSGIIGGEEFRSMKLWVRSGRRLSWLCINIVLNIIAASVIAHYQDTLQAVIALAIFLPMISDMSGCSGNQAVAVSLRELTLGLVRPREVFRVLFKEASVGIINGIALGMVLGVVATLWKGNPWLGLVVGSALAANTVISVVAGGLIPLLVRGLKLDPALVSAPMLTTITDMCGFFLALSFASMMLSYLTTG